MKFISSSLFEYVTSSFNTISFNVMINRNLDENLTEKILVPLSVNSTRFNIIDRVIIGELNETNN
jgi:hypothetical protein